VYEIHLVIRGALEEAVRRGLVSRNVALVAHAPGCGPSRGSNSVRGRPMSCGPSCEPPPATGSSRPSGRQLSPGCAATSSSG
jgi:hypothetical protein